MGTREYLLEKAKATGLEKGLEKSLEKGRLEERARAEAEKRSIVRNLINQTAFSDAEIASIAEVSLSVVEDVRKNLDR